MGDEPSDHELLRAWANDDEAAGNRLVRRHFDRVYGFFRAKVDDRPEDLVQRTFLLCLERHDRLWESASFRGFLFGIARRVLFKYFDELAKRKLDVSVGQASIEQLSGSPSQKIAVRQEHKLLLSALRTIPIDFQITLELFYWEDASVEEIGEVLDVRPGTVKSRLSRGRTMLKEALQDMDVEAELRKSTVEGLDDWARSLRVALGSPSRGT